MLRAVNHNKKIVICCPFVCGTSFLHLHVLKNEEYEHYRGNWDISEEYTLYKVIRDPVQRWHSWYNKFFLDNKLPIEENQANTFGLEYINKKNIKVWFDHFKTVMHYDGHTGLQKYIHYNDKRFIGQNEKFILSNQLQVFLGNTKNAYKDKVYDYKLRNEIDKYLYDLYKIDINWIKTLEVIK